MPSAETKGRVSFPSQSTNTSTLFVVVEIFISSWPNGDLPSSGAAAEAVVEPDQVFFCIFGLFCEVVLCRKPSFHFFFSVSALVLIFLPVFVGFVIWDGFSVPHAPWVCSFTTVPFLVSCVSYGVIFLLLFRAFYLGGFHV